MKLFNLDHLVNLNRDLNLLPIQNIFGGEHSQFMYIYLYINGHWTAEEYQILLSSYYLKLNKKLQNSIFLPTNISGQYLDIFKRLEIRSTSGKFYSFYSHLILILIRTSNSFIIPVVVPALKINWFYIFMYIIKKCIFYFIFSKLAVLYTEIFIFR